MSTASDPLVNIMAAAPGSRLWVLRCYIEALRKLKAEQAMLSP